MMLEAGGLVRQEELKKRTESTLQALLPFFKPCLDFATTKDSFTKNFKKLLTKIYDYEKMDERILHPDDLHFIMLTTISFLKVHTSFAFSMNDTKAIVCINLKTNKTFPLVYQTKSRASSVEFYAAKIVGMVVGDLCT
jgi:hypothetical protein